MESLLLYESQFLQLRLDFLGIGVRTLAVAALITAARRTTSTT
jgi:hypothetical protein